MFPDMKHWNIYDILMKNVDYVLIFFNNDII